MTYCSKFHVSRTIDEVPDAILGAEDIVTPNLKLILGLVWTLILNYQIAVGLAAEDTSSDKGSKKISPKQGLLDFVNVSLLYFAL